MSDKELEQKNETAAKKKAEKHNKNSDPAHKLEQAEGEIGGPSGLEPTRYGDWERKGIISDF
jgi:hypothetical protein